MYRIKGILGKVKLFIKNPTQAIKEYKLNREFNEKYRPMQEYDERKYDIDEYSDEDLDDYEYEDDDSYKDDLEDYEDDEDYVVTGYGLEELKEMFDEWDE